MNAHRQDDDGTVIKVCACGASYTPLTFAALRLVGTQPYSSKEHLEIRECAACVSSISILVPHVSR